MYLFIFRLLFLYYTILVAEGVGSQPHFVPGVEGFEI